MVSSFKKVSFPSEVEPLLLVAVGMSAVVFTPIGLVLIYYLSVVV